MTGFDTDTLGTFTRETPRPGSQREAARRKARIGMERARLPIGLASEGSFGPDPFTGMVPWNVELIAWLDDRMGIEVVGMAQGPARSGHLLSDDWSAVAAFAQREGFPQHRLVLVSVSPQGPVHDEIRYLTDYFSDVHLGDADVAGVQLQWKKVWVKGHPPH